MRYANLAKLANTVIVLALALFFFLIPAATVTWKLFDPGLRGPTIPRLAFRLHEDLAPRYERWARERLASGRAAELSTHDISGTEWPVFGSVMYLWALESLQKAWEKDPGLAAVAPKETAHGAIEAAAALVLDPGHASWVKKHWGDAYLRRENTFYRMLLIAAMTAHHRLTGDARHLAFLREQVEGLAAEIDASPHGLLDDYPGECYPTDVLTAVACIRRADAILGADHSAFAARAIRGFQGNAVDERGLPTYSADSGSGTGHGPARGCGNAYACLSAPELWPERAKDWYAAFEKDYWQERWTAAGFREFPKDLPGFDWYADVDAGPVIAGYGVSACAFGLGAARINGRFDHAWPLAAMTLAASWPLPDGTLLVPRFLSNAVDAPYLGEAGILFNLTRLPADRDRVTIGGSAPPLVYVAISFFVLVGLTMSLLAIRDLRRWRKDQARRPVSRVRLQLALWTTSILIGAAALTSGWPLPGLLMFLLAQYLPRRGKKSLGVRV